MKEFKKIGDCVSSKIEDKTKINVYAPRETFTRLKMIAIENQTSVSEMIRVMIDDYLSSHDNDGTSKTA